MKRTIIILLLSMLLLSCNSSEETTTVSSGYIHDQSFALGTVVSIKIYDSNDTSIFPEIFSYIDELEKTFSRTIEGSDVYRINQEGQSSSPAPVQVTHATSELLAKALEFSKLSQGRFEPTIAPLVSLWDIGGIQPYLPKYEEIQALLPLVDYQKVLVDTTAQTVQIGKSMSIDLGAIAKGYIGDKVVEKLQEKGISQALINLGGNVITVGSKPGDKPFLIGVQNPLAARNIPLGIIKIKDTSIVSSGTYERFMEVDGVVYHHILDSETGYPVDNDILQVTILSDESVDGDGYSTTLFAMGLEEGFALARNTEGIEAAFVTKDLSIRATPGFLKVFTLEDNSFTIVE